MDSKPRSPLPGWVDALGIPDNSFAPEVPTESIIGTSSAATGDLAEEGSAFVRNKVEYERSVRKLREMQRAETSGRDRSIAEILSIVLATNFQNEATIKNLQRDLVRLTKEAWAARGEADGLADELRRERLAFAKASHRRKKEVEGWKRRAGRLGKRCEQLERELKKRGRGGARARTGREGGDGEEAEGWKRKADEMEEKYERLEKELGEKEALIKLWKVRRAREKKGQGGEADATASSTVLSSTGTIAVTFSDAAFENGQIIHRTDRERLVSSHGRYDATITSQGAANDGPLPFKSDDGDCKGGKCDSGTNNAEGEWSDREIRARAKMLLRRANRSDDDRSSDLSSQLRKPSVLSSPPRSLAEALGASGLKGGLGWIREADELELTGKNTSDDLQGCSTLDYADEDPPPRDMTSLPPLRRLSSLTSCSSRLSSLASCSSLNDD